MELRTDASLIKIHIRGDSKFIIAYQSLVYFPLAESRELIETILIL